MPQPRMIKSVQDIRTLAGTVDQTFRPHKAFLRIACLEMEKARRNLERASAMRRIEGIDQRFKDIEEEKRRLSRVLEEHGEKCPRLDPREAGSRGITPLSGRGFKFRY